MVTIVSRCRLRLVCSELFSMISSCSRRAVKALAEFLRRQAERWVCERLNVVLEAMDERAQRHQLPMEPHGQAADAADQLPVDIQLVGQDPFLGVVELIGKTVGKAVERLDHLSGNHLKQGGGRLHLEPPAQFLAGCLDGVQLMPAARDEHALGQSKMQKADLLSGTA